MKLALCIVMILVWCVALNSEQLGVGAIGQSQKGQQSRSPLYSPIGKRDPFQIPKSKDKKRGPNSVEALEQIPISQLTLRAIMRGIGKPKAMFEGPDGETFILEEGALVGRERGSVSRILNSDVIITERTFNYLGEEALYERVLSIPEE